MRLVRILLAAAMLLIPAAAGASIGPTDSVPRNPEDALPAGRFLGACEGRKYAAVFDNRDSSRPATYTWYRWYQSKTVRVVTRHLGPGDIVRTAFRPTDRHTAMIIVVEGEALRIKITTNGWSNRECPRWILR
jgi:hypothetical protein